MGDGKHIVVSGSSGFIGKRLLTRLRHSGQRVAGWDIETGVDLTDWNRIEGERGIDAIVHLAAAAHVPDSFANPRRVYSNNVSSTINVLEKARETSARVVFASSYVYGFPEYLPIDERHPTSALNPYAQSKLLGEELCRGFHRDFAVRVVVLRLFNVYGPGQTGGLLIPTIMSGLKTGAVCLDDSTPRRDFVYVDDVVEAFVSALACEGSGFDVFNVGSGKSHSVGEVVAEVGHLCKRPFEVRYSHRRRRREIPETVADVAKAKEYLGWAPRIDLATGIGKILASLQTDPLGTP